MTLSLATARMRWARIDFRARFTTGAAASTTPACVQPNASSARFGGEVLFTVAPGTPIMLIG